MNSKANAFRNKNKKTTLTQQAPTATAAAPSAQLQNMVFNLTYQIFELTQRLGRVEATSRTNDYRSYAIMKLLGQAGISEEQISTKIYDLQVEDFETDSAKDDLARNLQNVDTDTAAEGHYAIATIQFYKDGAELIDERIVRSKLLLGKGELLNADTDNALIGLNVGESKEYSLTVGSEAKNAKVTLLGLRKSTQVEVQTENNG